ncbi:hypothetical protein GWN26_05025, partial [Candidatus Saccharibacteria bacterium]|nr:hypothetical protein [Candidatus Saccharibacteria bacterium]NIW78784.1 hypothetical protein [Calditrichia bacterium]
FPGNPTLKRFSTPAAKSNEAFAKLIPRWWQVFWDTGRHFNPRESAHLLMTPLNDHEWKGLIRLPEGVKNLRIDPPGHIKIRLSRIRLEVNGYGFPISPDFMKFQMMIPGKSWVDTDGQFDPFFYFDVEKYFSGKPVDINFRVALSPTTHPAKGNQ